jgi:hypothetical protein
VTRGGWLEPALIQREVRSHVDRNRACYEDGLGRNRYLEGIVVVKFLIDRDGRVARVADGGSHILDPQVIECVMRSFAAMRFPPPEGGLVTVAYPIHFVTEPDDAGAPADAAARHSP